MSVERRGNRGPTFGISYTLAKTLRDVEGFLFVAQDQLNPAADKGLANNHRRHQAPVPAHPPTIHGRIFVSSSSLPRAGTKSAGWFANRPLSVKFGILVGALLALTGARLLNVLALGDDIARGLGRRVEQPTVVVPGGDRFDARQFCEVQLACMKRQ